MEIPDDIREKASAIAKQGIYNGGVEWLTDDIARALLAERERAAKIAEGEVYAHRYRTWPFWPVQKDGTRGNRSSASEIVKHCDKIAAAIRSPRTEGETQ